MTKAMDMPLEQCIATINKAALARRPTVWNTYELAKTCIVDKIPGDFVECGVFAGTQIAAMYRACLDHAESRRIHLFDSFEGLPPATEPDGNAYFQNPDKLGSACSSLENTDSHLTRWGVPTDKLYFHIGWFESTVPNAFYADEKIALLRLDGDLYESTKVCMEFLYEKIPVGGFCIVDDFALGGCRKAILEYFESRKSEPPNPIPIPDGGGPVYWRVE